MNAERNDGGNSSMDCADEGAARENHACETIAGCECCAQPRRRSPIKTLLGIIVLLAAIAVGAYSMIAHSKAVPGGFATTGGTAGSSVATGGPADTGVKTPCCPPGRGDDKGAARSAVAPTSGSKRDGAPKSPSCDH